MLSCLKVRKSNEGGERKISMADDRDELVILIADLRHLGIETFTLNPDKDGTGGAGAAG